MFYGTELKTGYPSFIGAVLEGVAFLQRHYLEVVLDWAAKPDIVPLGGGVANSLLWYRIFAGMLGVPVTRPRSSGTETLGDIIIVARTMGIQEIAPDLGRVLAAEGEVFWPDDVWASVYDRQYRVYWEPCQVLKPVFAGGGE